MDKAERYAYGLELNLKRQFAKFSPPKHPNLPPVEQEVISALYTGFRQYYLENKAKIGRFDTMDTSWGKGFSEDPKGHPARYRGLGYYKIHEGRIVTLYIGEHFVGKLPSELEQLTALRELYIHKLPIAHIPWAAAFPHMENLKFFDCGLSHVPIFIAKCIKLKRLDLGRNQITTLPLFLGKLRNIIEFSILDNPIGEIPAFIGNWKQCKKLRFNNCNISEIPESFGQLQNLYYFTISHNKISFLPEVLGNCPKLEYLDIAHNNLPSLPEFFATIRFDYLDLSGNPLHPDGLKNPFEYYAIPPIELARRYSSDPLSLSDQEKTRLQWEGGFQERTILESATPPLLPTDPILKVINERLRVETEKGIHLLL